MSARRDRGEPGHLPAAPGKGRNAATSLTTMDEFFRIEFTYSQLAAVGLVAVALVAWVVRRRIVRRRREG